MIGIIDIGIGNVKSVQKAVDKFNVSYKKVAEPRDLREITKLIFPGVGSYPAAMRRLNDRGLTTSIQEFIQSGHYYLGICLGMQLLSRIGFEGGRTAGLGIFDAEVEIIKPASNEVLPHVGWNQVNHDGAGLFEGIPTNADFYFVHSYYMNLHEAILNYSVDYGGLHTCYVQKDNIFGAQFHPEKSQKVGLRFIENFLNA